MTELEHVPKFHPTRPFVGIKIYEERATSTAFIQPLIDPKDKGKWKINSLLLPPTMVQTYVSMTLYQVLKAIFKKIK